MKRLIIVVLVLITCMFATQAMALDEARHYLTVSGGVNQMTVASITDSSGATRISSSPGFNAMLATGLAWNVGRLEFSGGYNYQELDEQNLGGATAPLDGNITMASLLMSVFYDFNKDGMFSPYFGGGIGAARLDLSSVDLAGNDAFTFAYQLGLGLTMNTNDNFVIDVGYRLLATNDVDFGQTKADYLMFHNINVGLRWFL